VASAFLGDRVQIQSLSVEDGEIVVEMIAHGDDDPMCCPTRYTVARYALQEDELVQTAVEAEGVTPGLLGVVWEWERFVGGDDSVIEVDEPWKYTLTLNADGTYQVVADCNLAGGGYTLEGSRLALLPGPMTLAECGPDSLYDEFIARLGDVRTYVRPGGSDQLVLNLFADAGNLFFRPAPEATMERALEGTSWVLVSYRDGSDLSPVLDGTEITADFVEGELTGSAGCNNYFSSYTLDGAELTVGPAGATRKMCGAPEGIMEQEQAYLSLLDAVAGYRALGSQLELLDAEGAVVATFSVQK
jgi:heat shock protein HslJ